MSTRKFSHRFISGYSKFQETCKGWFYTPAVGVNLKEQDSWSDIYSIDNVGLDLVDPTSVQGTRIIKNLKVYVSLRPFGDSVFKGYQASIYVMKSGIGASPFFQRALKSNISGADMFSYVHPNWSTFPAISDQSNCIATVCIGDNLNNQPFCITVPQTIKIESGDRVVLIFRNINPIGSFTFNDPDWTVTDEYVFYKFNFTSEYDISF